ncbi:MAG: hypothetical protein LBP59_07315 [Planctomycetaceae bacterium]|jgi:hypothetical protein|nr:hypothetical protein [Planctomycetaceae bacterium]
MPFRIAIEAAGKFRTPMASSGVLYAVAAAQIDAGQIDEALITVTKIPAPSEQRSFLINASINAANNKHAEIAIKLLRRLVEIDFESGVVVGRIAQTFLENNESETAIRIIGLTSNPFDSWRSRCEFAVKLLEFNVAAARRIIETINDVDYRDWGELAFAQRIIQSGDFKLALKSIDCFSTPLRRAWSCFELCKLSNNLFEKLQLFERAALIFDAIEIDSKNADSMAKALRIMGKSAYLSGKLQVGGGNVSDENLIKILSIGESFFELSESAALMISSAVDGLRSKLFLAGTFLELGLIGGAGEYIDRREIENGDFNAIEWSKIWQWAAEADPQWESDWKRSVEVASIAQRKSEELGLAERIAEVIRRFAMRNAKLKPTGKPAEDQINLSARQFEEYYYSPFAIEDCGC